MDQKMQDALNKLKSAAGTIKSKEDAIDFLVKETKLPKAECEKAFDAIAKVDFKELSKNIPDGIADKLPGGLGKKSREEATALAKETLAAAQRHLDEQGLGHIHICPEVMGKINQLGNLTEVLDFCTLDERILPCVDFGHLNSRLQGQMDYGRALNEIENTVGIDRLRHMHIHFSKIEYTAGGEKKHLTFADEMYGPQFEPLMEELVKRDMSPTVICESAGTQTDDAKTMKNY